MRRPQDCPETSWGAVIRRRTLDRCCDAGWTRLRYATGLDSHRHQPMAAGGPEKPQPDGMESGGSSSVTSEAAVYYTLNERRTIVQAHMLPPQPPAVGSNGMAFQSVPCSRSRQEPIVMPPAAVEMCDVLNSTGDIFINFQRWMFIPRPFMSFMHAT